MGIQIAFTECNFSVSFKSVTFFDHAPSQFPSSTEAIPTPRVSTST